EGWAAEPVHVLALLGRENAKQLAVTTHLDRGSGDLAVQRVVLRDPEMGERVAIAVWALQRRRLTGPQRSFGLRLERHAGERDEQNYDAGVHDVTAVAPPVARQQTGEREHVGLAVLPVSRAGAAREFLHDRGGDEPAQGDREQ